MNYLNEMIRRNTRDMLRRNWGKAVALTVTVMAVLLLGSMLESAIGGLTGTYGLGTLLTIYRSSLSALTPARLAASTALIEQQQFCLDPQCGAGGTAAALSAAAGHLGMAHRPELWHL